MPEPRIEELRRRLERDPASRLFAQLAEEHRRSGALQQAVRVARAGLAHHPQYPSARLTLGRALQDAGELAAARVELEEAVRQAPDNIVARRCLGQVLENVGEIAGAVEQHAAALRMAPGDQGLQQHLRELVERLSSAPAVAVTRTHGAALAAEAPVAPAEGPAATAAAAEHGGPPEERAGERSGDAVVEPADDAGIEDSRAGGPGDAAGSDAAGSDAAGGSELAGPADEEGTGTAPFSSSTLAELYHRQGLHARAVEVYRQVVAADPTNARARARLDEIVVEHAEEAEHGAGNGRAVRQRVLERTISGLELMLTAIRRR